MLIISGREFRANQGKYFGLASQGIDVVLKTRGNGSFRLVPVADDDTLVSKAEFKKKLECSLHEMKDGKVDMKQDGETMDEFLKRLLCTE